MGGEDNWKEERCGPQRDREWRRGKRKGGRGKEERM
jgi:hypothetical protein